ncbi:uncharacterized protein B0T23DRAFT_431420 [Neurospora hispaniola]|uniref:Uncharacterized protein n=1 Tax=Neurospora hispaniola TaxID=588809 RepID=A0AAJ0MNM2_9PEZI|nr:hypothetical protein B0T23DRAFT_431420 [Neurospora hispaniola]
MPKDLQECGIPKIMFRSKYGEFVLRVLAGAIISLYAPPPGKSARESGPSGSEWVLFSPGKDRSAPKSNCTQKVQ